MRTGWSLLVCGALVGSLRADRVDEIVAGYLQRENVPGISLAVVKDGAVIKAKGYGLANVEWDVRATPDTVYQLASVTKQFTATGVMLLVEDGKVRLSEQIGKYVKDLPAAWSR